MKAFFASAFLISCFFLNSAFAQETRLTSLNQALELARKNGPNFKAITLQSVLAEKEVKVSNAALLPSIGFNANTDYNLNLPVQLIPAEIFGGPPGTFSEIQFGRPWISSSTFDFSMPLIHVDKWTQTKIAKSSAQQASFESEAAIQEYLRNVANLYLKVLVLVEANKLNYSLDSSAKVLFNITQQRYTNELVSKLDLNRTENLMLQTEQQTQTLKGNEEIALLNLGSLLGSNSKNLLVDDDLVAYEFKVFDQNSLTPSNRFSFRAAEESERIAHINLRKQQQAWLPKLSLNSRYTFASQQDNLFGSNGSRFDYGTVGVSLSVPLFKGGQNYHNSTKAKLQQDLTLINSQLKKINAERELLEWQIKRYENQRNLLNAQKRNQLALENLNLSFQAYDEGVISLDQLFNIYQEYVVAGNNFLQTKADAILYQTYFELENQ